MKNTEIIEEIKRIFQLKTDTDLARAINIEKSQVSRWRKNGFHPSTEKLLLLFVNKNKENANNS